MEIETKRTGLLASCVVVVAVHCALNWGNVGLFWGDAGVWRSMIARYAAGEVPYVDYYVHVPPLWLWLLKPWVLAFGDGVASLNVATSLLALVLAAFFACLAAQVPLGRATGVWIGTSALVCAVLASGWRGAPLAVGMYNPSIPVGAAALLGAVSLALALLRRPSALTAAACGFAAALCWVAKQDYWAPSLVAMTAGVMLWRGPRLDVVLACLGGFAITLLSSTAWMMNVLGPHGPLEIATGFGLAGDAGVARALPSWHQVAVEGAVGGILVGATSSLLLVFGARTLAVERALVASGLVAATLGCVYAWASSQGSTARAAEQIVTSLRSDATAHCLPFLLIAAITPLAWSTRIDGLRLLAIVALALRSRRGFEGVDWHSFLVEIPTYAWLLCARFGEAGQRTAVVLVTLFAAGIVHDSWRRPSTCVFPARCESVETARGTIRARGSSADLLLETAAVLDGVDPSRSRGVISEGHNGGFAYFLGRGNPSPATLGLSMVFGRAPAEVLASTSRLEPAPFFITNRTYDGVRVPALELSLTSWERRGSLHRYSVVDRPLYDALLSRCRELPPIVSARRPKFVAYDCNANGPKNGRSAVTADG